jgi:hypothetical protein
LSITVPFGTLGGVYAVSVTGSNGSLSHSTTVTVTVPAVPSVPQNLNAAAGNAQVSLSWSAPLSDGGSAITNYRVYRSVSSGAESLLATLSNVLTYVDTGVINGQTYYYKVTAVNSIGESALSNEASATPSAVAMSTFGKTTVGANEWSTGGVQYVVLSKYTMPESGTITKITAYIQSSDGTAQVGRACLYADNAGAPGALLAISSEVTVSSFGWYDFSLSYTNLLGSRNLWIGFSVVNGCRYRSDAGSTNQEAAHDQTYPSYPTYPDPFWSSLIYHNFADSVYATYY